MPGDGHGLPQAIAAVRAGVTSMPTGRLPSLAKRVATYAVPQSSFDDVQVGDDPKRIALRQRVVKQDTRMAKAPRDVERMDSTAEVEFQLKWTIESEPEDSPTHEHLV